MKHRVNTAQLADVPASPGTAAETAGGRWPGREKGGRFLSQPGLSARIVSYRPCISIYISIHAADPYMCIPTHPPGNNLALSIHLLQGRRKRKRKRKRNANQHVEVVYQGGLRSHVVPPGRTETGSTPVRESVSGSLVERYLGRRSLGDNYRYILQ